MNDTDALAGGDAPMPFLQRLGSMSVVALGIVAVIAVLLVTYSVATIKNDEADFHAARQVDNVSTLADMLARIEDGSIPLDRADNDAYPFGEWLRGKARNLKISHEVDNGRINVRIASLSEVECRRLGVILDDPRDFIESITVNGATFGNGAEFDPSRCAEDERVKVTRAAYTTSPDNVLHFRLKSAQ